MSKKKKKKNSLSRRLRDKRKNKHIEKIDLLGDKDVKVQLKASKTEVLEKLNKMRKNAKSDRELVYWLKMHDAHVVLGITWKEFCEKYLRDIGNTSSCIDRKVRAATAEFRLDVPVGTISEVAAEKLYALPKEEAQLVWKRANSHVKQGKKPKTKDIDREIEALKHEESKESVLSGLNDQEVLEYIIGKLSVLTRKQLNKLLKRVKTRIEVLKSEEQDEKVMFYEDEETANKHQEDGDSGEE